FPDGGFRAWSVVAGASLLLFCTFGYANSVGVFMEYYQNHQLKDENPSDIAWIGSIQIFILFGGSLFGGPLFDRYGAKVIWPPAAVYIFSVLMTSLCHELWQFMLVQGILGGIAMGLTMGPAMAAVGQYFYKKRGAAMGLAIAGSSIGGVVFPIALSKMLYSSSLGFGWTIRVLGFLMLGLMIPACLAIRARLPPRNGTFFLLEAFKLKLYVAIIVAAFFLLIGLFTPFFYIPTYAVQHGMSSQLAAYLSSILNGASFAGRVIPGILADRLGALNMLMVAGISSGILIFCWQSITTNAGIIVFSLLYGFFSGAIVSLMNFALANTTPNPQNIGTYMGMGMACISFAVLIGPPINGALVRDYDSYTPALDFSGAMVLLG
ncbi:major facilitator superfamily domain-containing protein, partial [Bisporella sp. PMI_857]